MNPAPCKPCQASAPPKAAEEARLIRTADWFGQSSVVFIEHNGVRYQLRQTRQGKLILTK
jgi:hemin uptake protein HemP